MPGAKHIKEFLEVNRANAFQILAAEKANEMSSDSSFVSEAKNSPS